MWRKTDKLKRMFAGIDDTDCSSICVVKEAVRQLIPGIGFKLKHDDENIKLTFDDKVTVIYNCRTKSLVERIRFGDIPREKPSGESEEGKVVN